MCDTCIECVTHAHLQPRPRRQRWLQRGQRRRSPSRKVAVTVAGRAMARFRLQNMAPRECGSGRSGESCQCGLFAARLARCWQTQSPSLNTFKLLWRSISTAGPPTSASLLGGNAAGVVRCARGMKREELVAAGHLQRLDRPHRRADVTQLAVTVAPCSTPQKSGQNSHECACSIHAIATQIPTSRTPAPYVARGFQPTCESASSAKFHKLQSSANLCWHGCVAGLTVGGLSAPAQHRRGV